MGKDDPPSLKSCGFLNVVDVCLIAATVVILCWVFWLGTRFPSLAYLFQGMSLMGITGLSCNVHCQRCLSIIRAIGGVFIFTFAARNTTNILSERLSWTDIQWYIYVYLGNILLIIVFAVFTQCTCAHYMLISGAGAVQLIITGMLPIHMFFRMGSGGGGGQVQQVPPRR